MTVEAIIDDIDKHFNGQIVRLMSLVHSELVDGTPVKTGWARANWVPSIGLPPEQRKKGERKGDAAAASIKSQAKLIEVSKNYDIKRGVSIYVSNNVPYIRKLNASHRTAQGFIPKAIDNALARA